MDYVVYPVVPTKMNKRPKQWLKNKPKAELANPLQLHIQRSIYGTEIDAFLPDDDFDLGLLKFN